MITIICANCGVCLDIKESDARQNGHHFCNRSCYGEWRSKQQTGEKNKMWEGGKTKITCEICKKEVIRFPEYIKKRKHLFCSQKCYRVWRKEQQQKHISTCIICGKLKQSTASRLKKGIDKTCSKTCEAILKAKLRLKEGNPNWNNGSSQEEYCPKFNKPFRRGVRAIWGYACGLCGKPQSENTVQCYGGVLIYNLAVHHVHYVKSACCDGDQSNWHFIPLCAECHGKTNGHREEYEQIFMDIILNKRNGKSYLTESEYIAYFAIKRFNQNITINDFLQGLYKIEPLNSSNH